LISSAIRRFFAAESSAGIVLAVATVLALIASNSPWHDSYEAFRQIPGELRVGPGWLDLSKPLIVWVNDLWMAVFFFLVGLEIKRELVVGELSTPRQALMPAGAALGGMVVPALIYVFFNRGNSVALAGWAIPSATDIAFALGILMLLGNRAPVSLKVFLTAVAIIDDLGAIVVIALFYTSDLSLVMLGAALAGCGVLWLLNRFGVMRLGPYILVGLVVWLCVLKSGIHPTLAGVATAFAVPLRNPKGDSPLESTEHALHPWVSFVVLPVFAFTNAGVSLHGLSLDILLAPVPLGIAAGLVVGKAIGVFGTAWLLVRFFGTDWPAHANRMQFFGMCMLCGVGFTMSLFIGGLAFEGKEALLDTELKLGVLCGSLISGAIGTLVLLRAERRSASRLRRLQA
jgi:NhaA family Na+:H+ antiporter